MWVLGVGRVLVVVYEQRSLCLQGVLNQRSANYSLGTKYGPLPVFVNKVLLEHSHPIC